MASMFYSLNAFTENKKLLGYCEDESIVKSSGFSLSFLPCFQPNPGFAIQIIASCNDLLLCCSNPLKQKKIFICNPVTKQWKRLPRVPLFHKNVKVGLICHPIEGSSFQINYTVVRITKYWGYHTSFNVETFSSTTGKWIQSEVASPPQLCVGPTSFDGVIVYNGMLHWFCNASAIMVYDPSSQSFHLLYIPFILDFSYIPRFGVFHGRLRICNYNREDYYSIWELEDYNLGKWVLIHQLQSVDINATKLSYRKLQPMALHPTDGDSMFLFFDNFIVLFNMKKRSMEAVTEAETRNWMYGHPNPNVITITLPSWPTQIL